MAGVRFLAAVRTFSLLHAVQTGSEVHPASFQMDPRVNRPSREADHPPPSNAEVKNNGATPPLPQRIRGIALN
jgi:hypothetical protein